MSRVIRKTEGSRKKREGMRDVRKKREVSRKVRDGMKEEIIR